MVIVPLPFDTSTSPKPRDLPRGSVTRNNRCDIHITLDTEAKDFLIEKGYNPDFGARPLKRVIEEHIEDPLAEELLRGTFKGTSHLAVACRNGRLTFETREAEKKAEDPATL